MIVLVLNQLLISNCMSININNIEVLIEIPKGSKVKYEYNYKTKKLSCDRFLHTPMDYFFNYGYIPHTWGNDNDELDVVVLCDETLLSTTHIHCKILGVLETDDEHGGDPKIIAVPSDKIDPHSKQITSLTDIKKHTLDKLYMFFSKYKELEPGKWTKINGFKDKETAKLIIEQGVAEYKKKYPKKIDN